MPSEDLFIRKTFRKFLIPSLIALYGTNIASFGNSFLAGRLIGKEALSVMSILSSFTFLYMMLGCLISIGAATRSSIALGSEDYETAAKYEWLALFLSVAVPVAISIVCLIGFHGLFSWLGADEAAFATGAAYGRLVLAFGFLNTLMYFPFNFLRLIGKGKYGMYSFGTMGILDVILVYIFLKRGMGTTGIALGFILSMAFADCAGLIFLLRNNSLFKMVRPKAAEIPLMLRQIFVFGSAPALNNLCKMLRTVTMNMLVAGAFGSDGISSLAVGFSIMNLASSSVTGFGQALSPIVGVLHGERDRKGVRQALKASVLYAAVFHALIALLLFVFAARVAAAFGITGDAHIRDTAVIIRLVGISLIPSAVINVLIYYYSAIRQNMCSILLTVCHAFIFIVAFAAIHLRFDKSPLYAACFITAELISFIIMYVYAKLIRTVHHNLEGVLLEEKVYADKFFSTVSAGTEEGAVETSGKVVSFCEENEIDPMLCMKLPLVVEELLVVLARHCFPGTEHDTIDVRISLHGQEVTMRLRCGGATFNPIEWYIDRKTRLAKEDFMLDESFGMNVVDKLVKDVKYSRVFDANNLVVTIG